MEKLQEQDQVSEQHENTLTQKLSKELHKVKADCADLEGRLTKVESNLEILAQHLNMTEISQETEATYETIDKYITERIQESLSEDEHEVDTEGVSTNWNYYVAKKGGYDEILYMAVQDFLKFDKDPVEFLAFLVKKRDREVKECLDHLQEEYQHLEGHQLQKHFTQLWELHHNLLKKKLVRTWKEEVFLEAFDTFLSWLQH